MANRRSSGASTEIYSELDALVNLLSSGHPPAAPHRADQQHTHQAAAPGAARGKLEKQNSDVMSELEEVFSNIQSPQSEGKMK